LIVFVNTVLVPLAYFDKTQFCLIVDVYVVIIYCALASSTSTEDLMFLSQFLSCRLVGCCDCSKSDERWWIFLQDFWMW